MLDCDSLYFIWTIVALSLIAVVGVPYYFVKKEQDMLKKRKQNALLSSKGSVHSSRILYRDCAWGPEITIENNGKQKEE